MKVKTQSHLACLTIIMSFITRYSFCEVMHYLSVDYTNNASIQCEADVLVDTDPRYCTAQ